MRVFRYWRLGFSAAVALSVGIAFATDPVYPDCNRKPTSADVEGAKGAHRAASQFYERGDYDKAIRYWNDAYGFDCTVHSLLLNIANAYERKGDKQGAIVTLETYIKRAGSDPTIEERVRNLKAASGLSTGPITTTVPSTTSASALPTTSPTTLPTVTPSSTVQRPYGLAPWVVVGVGAVGFVGGLILVPVGTSAINEAETHCTNRKCADNDAGKQYYASGNEGRVRVGIGIAGITIGGVAMAGGLVWQLLLNRPRETPAPAVAKKLSGPSAVKVTPVIGPGQTGLTISGSF